jgi:xanthosine phosphorylase
LTSGWTDRARISHDVDDPDIVISSAAATVLAQRAPAPPRVGIVLGSGLGAVADAVTEPVAVGFDELPGFPTPTVTGHAGRAVLGRIAGVPVVVLQGRAHLYEGKGPDALRAPVRALKAAGTEIVVLTNAAGSLRRDAGPGTLMAITDHINLTGSNPLVGPNDPAVGPRFPALRDAYDPTLLAQLRAAADEIGLRLAEGVYLAVSGPSFETAAEIRAFRALGADAVGMSTVHETIVARHCGLRVLGLSVITNYAEGLSEQSLSHEQTLHDAERAGEDLARLLVAFIGRITSCSEPQGR